QAFAVWVRRLPVWERIACPSILALPYVLVTVAAGQFRWGWFFLYALLPVGVAVLLQQARQVDCGTKPAAGATEDGGPRGSWLDFVVLGTLGLAVDLRWFEGAWPPHMAIFNKMLLLDAGIYGFLAVRQLPG